MARTTSVGLLKLLTRFGPRAPVSRIQSLSKVKNPLESARPR